MKKISEMSIGEVAAFVCDHLYKYGIKVTLSGGACVSIYSKNRYQSYDMDFIIQFGVREKDIKSSLAAIGFFEHGRHFVNTDTQFFIEFPPGPLAIGDEHIQKTAELEFPTGKLFLLSPTDCVKDRLAGYYHWNDRQCLEQAILVANDQVVDFGEIERWSGKEGKSVDFKKIRKLFSGKNCGK